MSRLFAHSQNDYSKPYRSSSALPDRPFVPSFFSAWIFGEKKNKSKNENENENENKKNKNRKRIRGKTRPRKILEEKEKKKQKPKKKNKFVQCGMLYVVCFLVCF